jgi:hypothetical protein
VASYHYVDAGPMPTLTTTNYTAKGRRAELDEDRRLHAGPVGWRRERRVFTDEEFTNPEEQKGDQQMNSPARKQTISLSADCYTDETNQRMNGVGELELHTPPHYSDPPRRWHPRIIEPRVDRPAFRMPTLDEINRAAPDTSMFVLHLHDCFDMTSATDADGGFQNYLVDYAGIHELHKRHKPRPRGLLWASFICFGIAALFFVALIRELL